MKEAIAEGLTEFFQQNPQINESFKVDAKPKFKTSIMEMLDRTKSELGSTAYKSVGDFTTNSLPTSTGLNITSTNTLAEGSALPQGEVNLDTIAQFLKK
jgi:hypothetical protein